MAELLELQLKKWAGLGPEIPGLKSGPTPALALMENVHSSSGMSKD